MSKLVIEPTQTAQWQHLVVEAAQDSHININPEMESYLVYLLMRFLKDQGLGHMMLGLKYLQIHTANSPSKYDHLRDVADHCLLLSGLYPQIAEKRNVNLSYFVNLGRTAYLDLSESIHHAGASLYREVSNAFIQLMDILLTIRSYTSTPVLKPIQAFDLWNETGSLVAQSSIHLVEHSQRH